MAVSEQTPIKAHTGNGVSTVFAFDFLVLDEDDILALVDGTEVSAALYTVAGVGVTNGGTVTFDTAPGAGVSVVLMRDSTLTRATDYQSNGDLLAAVVNRDFDRIWLVLQEIVDGSKGSQRTVRAPVGEVIDEMPAAASRASKLLGFDTAGDPEATSFTQAQVAAAIAALAPNGTSGTIILRELHTATAGQTIFNLANTYAPGVNSLIVVLDGDPLPALADYAETNSTRVTFDSGLIEGQEVEFIIGRLVTSGVEMTQIAGNTGVADHLTGGPTDQASYFFRRRATYSGGTPGFVNAALWADTFVESSVGSGVSTAASFEWAIVGVMRNYSNAGENVGIYGQGLKYSTGPTWGGVFEVKEMQATADPTTGTVALEVDVRANGTDVNNCRVGVDLVFGKHDTGAAAVQGSYGYRIQDAQGAGVNSVKSGFTTWNMTCDVGFDTSVGVINQAAYKMAEGQPIAFNAAASRKLYHDGSGLRFADASNTIIGRITDGGAYQGAGGVQILGARDTGYAAMTGTTNKATVLDTATVTTAQLAQRVKALQEALTAHGIIGA